MNAKVNFFTNTTSEILANKIDYSPLAENLMVISLGLLLAFLAYRLIRLMVKVVLASYRTTLLMYVLAVVCYYATGLTVVGLIIKKFPEFASLDFIEYVTIKEANGRVTILPADKFRQKSNDESNDEK